MRHIYIHKNASTATTPTVVLDSITLITKDGCNYQANVTSDGGSTITARGVSFYTTPDCSGSYIDVTSAAGVGIFGGQTTSLVQGTTYYARAWAENSVGRSVSNIISFTTSSAVVVPTTWITGVTKFDTDAPEIAWQLQSLGGGTVTVSGICYSSTNTNPTTADSKTTNGPLTVSDFVSIISGLTPNTRYYFRAYATNQAGTGYSNTLNFVTTEWSVLLSFQTNCASRFMPSIYATSGQYKWSLGNGTEVNGGAVDYTYPDSTTKTVKLYGKGTCQISNLYLYNCAILGAVDASNSAFATTGVWYLQGNPGLNSIQLPGSITVPVSEFYAYNCAISGTLNLSAIGTVSDIAISISGNAGLTGITFAQTITGTIASFVAQSVGISGNFDFSKFTSLKNDFEFSMAYCSGLTGVTFANTSSSAATIMLHGSAIDYTNIVAFSNLGGGTRCEIDLIDNSMTTAQVNRILYEANSVVSSASTTRRLMISGTNAAPDSSSGGYDGTTAKAQLMSKGFIVYTN